MKTKLISMSIIIMLALSSAIIVFSIHSKAGSQDGQPSWPGEDEWFFADDDPNEAGCEDWKDIQSVYYHLNDYYVYYRIEFYGYPNITEHDMRVKWFIDTDLPHNMGWQGNKVYDAEYLLFLEDSPKPHGDGDVDIYLIHDSNNDGFMNDEVKNTNGTGYEDFQIFNESIAGYNITGHYLYIYLRQANISNPEHPFFTWTTDQADPNLDSSSAQDQSDNYWNTSLSKADVFIEKSDSKDPIFTNESFSYQLTITNNGPHVARHYNITDIQPSNITFNYATPVPTEINGLEYRWYIPMINVSETKIIIINASVNPGFSGTITNTANATNTYDPSTQDNTDTEETTVLKVVDLSIEKTSEYDAPVYAGSPIVYTINVTNHGPGIATNVNVTDTQPSGITFNGATPNPTDVTGFEYRWYIPIINVSETKTIIINANVNPGFSGTIVNNATVESDSYDPIDDNEDNDTIIVLPPANLSIIKTSEYDAPAHAGSPIVYTINVTNYGPGIATNVNVTDTIPDGVTYENATPEPTEINGLEYRWYIPIINVSETKIIIINVTVNESFYGTIVNTATIEYDGYDPDNGNDDNDTIIVLPIADISIIKTSEYKSPLYANNPITYYLNVTNYGPDNATNITVIDVLPGNVTFVSASPSDDWNDSLEYRWFIPRLNVTESFIIKINVTVNEGFYGLITNYASVTTEESYDSNKTNNQNNITITVSKKSGGGGGGGYIPSTDGDEFIDEQPTAIIGGPYFGTPNEEIQFDATESHDNDEDGQLIIRYDWKFSEDQEWQGDLGATPIYIYTQPGVYTVTLKVIDDENNSATNTTTVTIIQPNIPPTIPEINGPNNGTINILYNYTVVSIDEDGDELKYTIDWGDGTSNESEFLPSGEPYNVYHTWAVAGNYTISVTADDGSTVSANDTTIKINEPPKLKQKGFDYLLLLLLLLLFLILLLLILAKRRKDKKEEEQKPKGKPKSS
ncbi:MAG: hypothetical protein BV457_05225 [Thermoplasmata archaeon M9B1D]|nr:MAG: hypothetical protein BV457_05225 [Thermoplasmata archaeon M9B1D]PNX50882.1 MAG: hypothetical protein BV456_05180 [Thermoplasmata archaeon M8B2D]